MFLTNTANYLTERILLAESITDNLAELQQLEKVAEPGFLKSYLDDLVPHLVNFAFRAVLAVLIYFIGRKIIGWLRRLLRRALERSGVDEGVKQFLDSCAKITLYLILAMAVINELGMETTSIVAVLGSAGLALGLALQGSLSNFAGGVLILLFKPFKVGDYIMEDTHGNEGTVAEIMIFYTKLSTPDNRTVVIPNGTLANASLTNVTQQDRRRVDVYVGVSYDTDIRRAKKLLSEILLSEPSRMEEEDWQVFVDELGDSSVRLGCRLWVAAADYWQVKWRLNERIKEVFDENQIEIPYNHLTVELKQ
ncbi:MAG: mechanosensitive ion channel [Lachnospiraceae bacterium]|jgi:small conductance mechanosensitive channel|nr:mechanosensitive ion channel [Lachnospiraceae bacterium]MCI8871812.1 mechanosensitive ion channel [Lachnospiraceae bacterium]GFI30174.1 small-conductance mechanosensitive channel [Lachnospiraceae bacterium]